MMTFFRNWEDGYGYNGVGGFAGVDDGCGDDDVGDDADLSRLLALVQTCPNPSTACDGPWRSCVTE